MTDIPDTILTAAAGSALGAALGRRRNIVEMTALAEAAVLRPNDPGAWPHALRSALAARIANLHGEATLAARFTADTDAAFAPLADPGESGAEQGLGAVLAFVDRVATSPRDATEADIRALTAAGVSDADIVRLAELIAFFAYELRVVAGLRLLEERA